MDIKSYDGCTEGNVSGRGQILNAAILVPDEIAQYVKGMCTFKMK